VGSPGRAAGSVHEGRQLPNLVWTELEINHCPAERHSGYALILLVYLALRSLTREPIEPRLFGMTTVIGHRAPRSVLVAFVLVLTLGVVLVPASSSAAPQEDEDLQLLDRHFGLHMGGTIASGVFGTGALVVGIHNFALFAEGEPTFFLALSLTSLGAATVVSSATSTQQGVSNWLRMRKRLGSSSPPQRRLIREAEADRLQRNAIQRAIGLAADGLFLGIGIALMAAASPELGLPLVLDGAVLLGIDIYRIAVDDQVARKWRSRDRDADRGYFSQSRDVHRPSRLRGFLVAPSLVPGPRTLEPSGLMVVAAGAF